MWNNKLQLLQLRRSLVRLNAARLFGQCGCRGQSNICLGLIAMQKLVGRAFRSHTIR